MSVDGVRHLKTFEGTTPSSVWLRGDRAAWSATGTSTAANARVVRGNTGTYATPSPPAWADHNFR